MKLRTMSPAPASSTSGQRQLRQDHRGPESVGCARLPRMPRAAFFQHIAAAGLRDVQRRREAEAAWPSGRRSPRHSQRRHSRRRRPPSTAVRSAASPRANTRTPAMAKSRPMLPPMTLEHQALEQELPDDAPACRADGDANGDLAGARRRTREQQVGDIRAGDEQHEHDRAHHRDETSPARPADESVGERFHRPLVTSLRRSGYAAVSCCGDAVHFRLRLPGARCVAQPAEHAQLHGAVRCCCRFARHERRPHSVSSGNLMPSGITPTIVAGCPFDAQHAGRARGIAAVAALPEVVADHDDGLGAGALVGGCQITAEDRRLPQQAEVLAVSNVPLDLFRQRAIAADVHRAVAIRGEAVEAPARSRQSCRSAYDTLERRPERFCHDIM